MKNREGIKKQKNRKFLEINHRKFSIFNFINKKAFGILIALTIILSAALVLQIQLLAQKSEMLSQSQKELTKLFEENNGKGAMFSLSPEKTLEMSQLAQNLNFEKIDKVYYIRATENTVLAK